MYAIGWMNILPPLQNAMCPLCWPRSVDISVLVKNQGLSTVRHLQRTWILCSPFFHKSFAKETMYFSVVVLSRRASGASELSGPRRSMRYAFMALWREDRCQVGSSGGEGNGLAVDGSYRPRCASYFERKGLEWTKNVIWNFVVTW